MALYFNHCKGEYCPALGKEKEQNVTRLKMTNSFEALILLAV